MTAPHAPASWELLDGHLADDEQVWVELHGRHGELVVGTDRRLIEITDARISVDWPWEEVDDVAPVGGHGALRIRRRDRREHLDIEPAGERTEIMQAVTVLALLAVDASRYGARLEALRRTAGSAEGSAAGSVDRGGGGRRSPLPGRRPVTQRASRGP
jgi:hypothetical protein